jgi:hypothetical protein
MYEVRQENTLSFLGKKEETGGVHAAALADTCTGAGVGPASLFETRQNTAGVRGPAGVLPVPPGFSAKVRSLTVT